MNTLSTPLRFGSTEKDMSQLASDCFILLCSESDLSMACLPEQTQLYLKPIVQDEGFCGKQNQALLVHRPLGMCVKRLCLWGCGKAITYQSMQKLFSYLGQYHAEQLHCSPCTQEATILKQIASAFLSSRYQFKTYKSTPNKIIQQSLTLLCQHPTKYDSACKQQLAMHEGMTTTRHLANAAGNMCTPERLAEQAMQLADKHPKIHTTILSEPELTQLGMEAYLAVNRASVHPASMPIVRYTGTSDIQKPIVFIGKGVTFDTGGISLKSAQGMHHMIYDMAGAACVVGLMQALAILDLPINVIGILATAENSIDGNAYRPGDILQTKSGQTVEVTSTDAEGRLLICDVLTYAEQFNPKAVIDIATLTGAAITALGHHANALMCNNSELERALLTAGEQTQDRAWPFPLWSEYQDALDSSAADMLNAGRNSPGMITAGCFLSRFAKNYPWAHLDIAGTSFHYGKQNTATGRPLPLLLQYLINAINSTESA